MLTIKEALVNRRAELVQTISLKQARCDRSESEAATLEEARLRLLSEAARFRGERDEALIRLEEIERVLQSHETATPDAGTAAKPQPPKARRRFHSEGATVQVVRLLYRCPEGLSVSDLLRLSGVGDRMQRKIVARLIEDELAVRDGNIIRLTESGRSEWEASPLFLRSHRQRAASAEQ